MPPRRWHYRNVPDWAFAIPDPCLAEAVVEAFVSRGFAKQAGADAKLLAIGDGIVAKIHTGRLTNSAACKAAAVAQRRYNEAKCIAQQRGSRSAHVSRRLTASR